MIGDETVAERELAKILVQRAEEFVSHIESTSSNSRLGGEDCVDAISDLGALRFRVWHSLPNTERQEIERTNESLSSRLGRLSDSRKVELTACLEKGASEALQKAVDALKKLETKLTKGGIGTMITGIELNADLFYWREKLAYALSFSENQGLMVSQSLKGRIAHLDDDLKRILPEVIRIYRSLNDDPTPYPERHPQLFWWRRI